MDAWRETTRRIKVMRGGKLIETQEEADVLVMGPMFIYIGDGGLFHLAHDYTGITLAVVNEKEDAERIGELFSARCSSALQEKEKDRMLAKIPYSISQWMIQCNDEQRYVPLPGADDAED